MLKDIRGIEIQGANFDARTQLSLFCEGNRSAKVILLYKRNGEGGNTDLDNKIDGVNMSDELKALLDSL